MSLSNSLLRIASLVSLAVGCAAGGPRVDAPTAHTRVLCAGAPVQGDAELASYAGCRRIKGDLALSGVSSLAPLAALERVDGTLSISRSSLDSLDGLERLRAVEGLSLEHDGELDDVSALESLETAKRLSFVGTPRLSSPNGLERLSELDTLVVRETGFLSLAGLEGLVRIGQLEIHGNRRLISLRALNGVHTVREVAMTKNPVLYGGLGILPRLTTPPLQLTARNNTALRASELDHLRAPRIEHDGIALR